MLRTLALLSSLFLIGCAAIHPSINLFTDLSQSPDTGCHQGYATDGTSHFLFDTHRILKRANDSTWHIIGVNDTPFEGLTGFDHIGDGDYFEGLLYAPVEHYTNCTDQSNSSVFVFNASTLVRSRVVLLSGAEEVSGVSILPDRREIWVSSYCNSAMLWVYDVDNLELKRTVPLNPALMNVQGIAFREPYFYAAQNDGRLFRIAQDGKATLVFQSASPGAHEGLDYSQGQLRWLIDEGLGEQKVHFLVPK